MKSRIELRKYFHISSWSNTFIGIEHKRFIFNFGFFAYKTLCDFHGYNFVFEFTFFDCFCSTFMTLNRKRILIGPGNGETIRYFFSCMPHSHIITRCLLNECRVRFDDMPWHGNETHRFGTSSNDGVTGTDHDPFCCICDTLKTDRKSTRLNSSHVSIPYAVFCLKKKTDSRGKTAAVPADSAMSASVADIVPADDIVVRRRQSAHQGGRNWQHRA